MRRDTIWGRGVFAAAGLLGAAGVVIGAAGAHRDGGDLARLASLYLLIHAAVAVALVGVAMRSRPAAVLGVATVLLIGVAAFAGDLTIVAFTGSHALSWLAPSGGLLLIVGWVCAAVVALGITFGDI